jgi:restriction endonuclease S subunit
MTNSNPSLSLSPSALRKGWQIVKFGEIAKNISKRVNPSETDLEVYVGLEHLDPQSLRITRRGVPSDVKGQKLRVRPGQIIFGKRRAYQKKVAVADFDCICSAHAMVLEAIQGKIIPELLPFFMQSGMFMDRAVAISEGSLSPTIKWKTLAIQEFPLPPLERQKEILEVLLKVEEADSRLADCIDSCLVGFRRLVDHVCNSDRNKEPFSSSRRFRLKDICKSNLRSLGTKTDDNYKFGYVDISSCSFPGLLEKPQRMKFKDAPSRARRIVSDGDVLVSTVRPNHQATCIFQASNNIVASTGFSVISPNDKKYSNWIFYSTLTNQFVYNLSNLMVGTSFPAVSDDDIMVQYIDIPKGNLFDKWSEVLGNTLSTYNNLLAKRKRYMAIRKNVLKTFLESQ